MQEINLRLRIVTGQGHGALIRARFGPWAALLPAGPLFISVIGALLTQFAAVATVGQCFGISPRVTAPISTACLLAIALTGSHRKVERVALRPWTGGGFAIASRVQRRTRTDHHGTSRGRHPARGAAISTDSSFCGTSARVPRTCPSCS